MTVNSYIKLPKEKIFVILHITGIHNIQIYLKGTTCPSEQLFSLPQEFSETKTYSCE